MSLMFGHSADLGGHLHHETAPLAIFHTLFCSQLTCQQSRQHLSVTHCLGWEAGNRQTHSNLILLGLLIYVLLQQTNPWTFRYQVFNSILPPLYFALSFITYFLRGYTTVIHNCRFWGYSTECKSMCMPMWISHSEGETILKCGQMCTWDAGW